MGNIQRRLGDNLRRVFQLSGAEGQPQWLESNEVSLVADVTGGGQGLAEPFHVQVEGIDHSAGDQFVSFRGVANDPVEANVLTNDPDNWLCIGHYQYGYPAGTTTSICYWRWTEFNTGRSLYLSARTFAVGEYMYSGQPVDDGVYLQGVKTPIMVPPGWDLLLQIKNGGAGAVSTYLEAMTFKVPHGSPLPRL